MGQSVSADDKHKPLIIQRNFEPTIHRRFVKDRVVSIELEDNFWTKARPEEVEIKDLRSGQVLFRLPPQDGAAATKHERKQLLDAFGVPIVGLQWTNSKPAHAEYIITPGGANSANEEVYRFNTMFNPYFYPLELAINPDSHNECVKVYVLGCWIARRAVVGIRRGIEGDVYKIAEFNAVDKVTNPKYRIEVAPGVDVSLILLFAAAMDEQARLHECGADRSALKTEIKRDKWRAQQAKLNPAMANYTFAPIIPVGGVAMGEPPVSKTTDTAATAVPIATAEAA